MFRYVYTVFDMFLLRFYDSILLSAPSCSQCELGYLEDATIQIEVIAGRQKKSK